MRTTWVQPADLLRHELWQSAREGKDVEDVRQRWIAAGGAADAPSAGASSEAVTPALVTLARKLHDELDGTPDPTATAEPSHWQDIRASWPTAPARANVPVDYLDRVTGAWVGRAVGCLLGKPVEKIPRRGIEEILRSADRWPLAGYFTGVGLDRDVAVRWPWNRASAGTSLVENIDGMPEDDDLNYTLMALRLVEAHGKDLTSDDVATAWLFDLPAGRTFTAERVAYRNLLDGIGPPVSALVRNPYREWIGAQIRTDLYGWVNPGNPAAAAEMAHRDAAVSHTRSGIHGAIAVAAMAATAVAGADIGMVLQAGAAVVPPGCRTAAALALGRSLQDVEPAAAYPQLEAAYPGMHWVHSLNNTALVAYALAAGRGDFVRSICLTVMGGWDTDSNGATVGAITGALSGGAGLPIEWSAPLHDRLATSIPGFDGSALSDLARRTVAAAS